ncbi:MAG: acyltransferase, partial [Clostridia bacterium]
MNHASIRVPKAGGNQHSVYLDLLRALAAFFVIVNHTNSRIFLMAEPTQLTWTVSVLWYYLSKIAVPLFVMISGACLLGKVDGYRKTARRFGRMLSALLIASYGYFLYDAWVNYGLWPRAMDFGAFLSLVWQQKISDSFWYLWFYLGLLIALPLLQRMAKSMEKRDILYLMTVSFGLYALWPLVTHYLPALTPNCYFVVPACGIFVGLLFAGRYLHCFTHITKRGMLCAGVVLVLSLGISLLLTRIEYERVPYGQTYLFMDDRMSPSLFIIASAMAALVLARGACMRLDTATSPSAAHLRAVITERGGCAFGVFLLQDLFIKLTKEW